MPMGIGSIGGIGGIGGIGSICGVRGCIFYRYYTFPIDTGLNWGKSVVIRDNSRHSVRMLSAIIAGGGIIIQL